MSRVLLLYRSYLITATVAMVAVVYFIFLIEHPLHIMVCTIAILLAIPLLSLTKAGQSAVLALIGRSVPRLAERGGIEANGRQQDDERIKDDAAAKGLAQSVEPQEAIRNRREARELARATINKWALGVASVAWIPGSHSLMTTGDVAMVVQVGSIYGVELDRTSAVSLFTSMAAPFISSQIAHTMLDFIPIVGWAAKSVVVGTVTKSVGEALIAYFHDRSPLPE